MAEFKRRKGEKQEGNGSWLCSPGPYRDEVAKACLSDPCIQGPEQFNKPIKLHMDVKNVRVVCLDVEENEITVSKKFKDASGVNRLRQHIQSRGGRDRTIYLVEGLASEYISVLGEEFSIAPSFFVNQERTAVWSLGQYRTTERLSFPSWLCSKDSFLLRYHEVIDLLDVELRSFAWSCATTGREVVVTRAYQGFLPEVVVRRKCSFWSGKRGTSGWNAVILCDPPLKRIIQRHENCNFSGECCPQHTVHTELWQGGYVDFSDSYQSSNLSNRLERKSMLGDLCYYFTKYPGVLGKCDNPQAAAIFPKKIVAAQYFVLKDFTRALIHQYEFSLSHLDGLDNLIQGDVESQWSDIHALGEQYSILCEDIENILLTLKIPLTGPNRGDTKESKDYSGDFQYIHMKLKQYKLRADRLISSLTGLASMVGNKEAVKESRRSLREAKNVKTLTVIGLIFIPLGYTSSLLSMNDVFLPGGARFGIYFAISIPIIFLVFFLAFFMDSGYNDKAEWSMKRFLDEKSSLLPM